MRGTPCRYLGRDYRVVWNETEVMGHPIARLRDSYEGCRRVDRLYVIELLIKHLKYLNFTLGHFLFAIRLLI